MPEPLPAIRWLDSVPSTQEVAHLLAEAGAVHGTTVVAREQQAGRGTRGRTWHSPLGGLWMSVICRPRDPASAECFSLRVGLAAAEVLEEAAGGSVPIMVKWPNDLYLAGRKLGGVLCEARWQGAILSWIVAGIGINVGNPIPADVRDSAVALRRVAPGLLAEQLAEPVARRVAAQASAGGPLSREELHAFDRRDYLRGRRLREPAEGIASGLEPGGGLVIVSDHGVPSVSSGGTVTLA